MTPMGSAHRGDIAGMPRGGEPVMHRRADLAALHGRLAPSMMASDKQDHPVAASDGLFQAVIDRGPGPIEIHAMKVEDPVRLKVAAADALVP